MTRKSFLVIWHIRYKHRWQRQIMEVAVAAAAFLFLGLVLSLAGYFSHILVLDTPLLQTVLNTSFPGMQEMHISLGREEEPQIGLLASLLFTFTEGGFLSAKSIVAESLPAFYMVPPSEKPMETVTPVIVQQQSIVEAAPLTSEPLQSTKIPQEEIRRGNVEVIIYNTHSSEAYHGIIGSNHKDESIDYCFGSWREDAGVIGVAVKLEEQLLRLGVNVYRIKKIHDGQIFRMAYVYSEDSVKEALNRFSDTRLVLDIHRDGAEGEDPFRIAINGQYAAQVALVVATGERSSRRWDSSLNRDMAKRLIYLINSRYPGLCRGAIFKTGAYNQHLHPGSLLIEVGNDCNTDAEAQYTARLLAPIIRDLLLEVR